MPIFRTHSKRQAERGDKSPAPVLPPDLRVQIIHILSRAVGRGILAGFPFDPPANPLWLDIYSQYLNEKGRFVLSPKGSRADPAEQCSRFLLEATDEDAIDLADMAFNKLDAFEKPLREHIPIVPDLSNFDAQTSPESAAQELNGRLREHDVPLQFVDGILVRTDSDYLHQETTMPALELLHDSRFAGAQHEFREAHKAYRQGRWDDAVSEANQAFESAMQCAMKEVGVSFSENDAAGVLAQKMVESKIFANVDAHYRGKLLGVLQQKLPPVRNPLNHGAGTRPRTATPEIAAYALHLAASDIVFVAAMLRRVKP
jgi:hypothetical protein